ncbi:Hypothetical_protein [Hexamita inflata]|uniref:Hypothetical_protein n=1 Tax=Hexamita inflata TaxID=28002 RepID=A0AA86QGY3_9EUKA|nr:Hypothetical protein HINF_LOCUS42113 [Hexamita inflata]
MKTAQVLKLRKIDPPHRKLVQKITPRDSINQVSFLTDEFSDVVFEKFSTINQVELKMSPLNILREKLMKGDLILELVQKVAVLQVKADVLEEVVQQQIFKLSIMM